jgi:hypothetical protein
MICGMAVAFFRLAGSDLDPISVKIVTVCDCVGNNEALDSHYLLERRRGDRQVS